MEELAVVGGGLDGVADGVAEVEDHAQAGLLLVLADDLGLDADAGGDDLRKSLWICDHSVRSAMLYPAWVRTGELSEYFIFILFHIAE